MANERGETVDDDLGNGMWDGHGVCVTSPLDQLCSFWFEFASSTFVCANPTAVTSVSGKPQRFLSSSDDNAASGKWDVGFEGHTSS